MKRKQKSVCIISFSPIVRDARVLREIEYLSPHYDITIIGQGDRPHPSWGEMGNVKWVPVASAVTGDGGARRWLGRFMGFGLLLSGKLSPAAYERWYWRQPIMRDTLAKAVASRADAFHANDWNTLPIAAEAARTVGGRFVFDDHEYAPLEFDNRRGWELLYSPIIRHMVGKYAPRAGAMITVAPAIAERYRSEFGFDPVVLMNAPPAAGQAPPKEIDFERVRLIHHGGALPVRQLEGMIRSLASCDRRYSLNFMLTGSDRNYLNYLKRTADELVPGRVTFHDPVAPENVLARIREFDMGIYNLPPVNFVHEVALPNKFFDFIVAGMPVCIGPSPSMAEIVRSYDLGCIARSFEPADVAAALNGLTPERLAEMQQGARRAAREINAEREMGKLREIYDRLLAEERVEV
jgi:hypothetical protein